MKYLPAVDGLRAVAVLSVVLFHAGFSFLSGGYVGVDVFFVISGFLITKILMDELNSSGRIDFPRFYYRRARRLFPALLFTLVATATAAFLLFTPQHFQRFGGELLYSIFSLSNFFFWNESGYFDTASELKPLLHTWSLSVEEQFYLAWPAALYLLYRIGRKTAVAAGLLVVFWLSLFLNFSFVDGSSAIAALLGPTIEMAFSDGASSIYFLTPFRAFEFVIGACLVWTPKAKGITADLAVGSGLGLIAYAMLSYDETTLFPSYNALAPCLGAALCIFGCNSRRVGLLLSNPTSVFVGKISYSVYLAHWPIIVFSKYWLMRDFTTGEMAATSAASVVVGYGMYRFIECRYRHASAAHSRSTYGLKCAFAAMALCLPAASLWASSGWQWRTPEPPAAIVAQLKDSKQFHKDQYGGAGFTSNGWITGGESGRADIVVIGDSHAKQYSFGLAELLGKPQKLSIYISSVSCLMLPDMTRLTPGADWDRLCQGGLDSALEVINRSPKAIILLAERWHSQIKISGSITSGLRLDNLPQQERIDYVAGKVEDLRKAISPRPLLVFGSVPETQSPDSIGCFTRPQFFPVDCGARLAAPLANHRTAELRRTMADHFTSVDGLIFLDPYSALCNDEVCRAIKDGNVLYSDANHLSKQGSLLVVAHFMDQIQQQLGKRL